MDGADNYRKGTSMERALNILSGIDMGRVERNQAIYKENEEFEEVETAEAVEVKDEAKGSGFLGRFLGVVGIALILVVVLACLSLIIPKIAGYSGYVVVSGSMEPTIPVGSIVYSKPSDPALMRAGDVIVFVDESRGPTPITHRIMTNNPMTGVITTKGDANENEDVNPVTYENVIGRVEAYVPRIGFTAAMFSTLLGKIIAIFLLLEGWLLIEIGRRLKAKEQHSIT